MQKTKLPKNAMVVIPAAVKGEAFSIICQYPPQFRTINCFGVHDQIVYHRLKFPWTTFVIRCFFDFKYKTNSFASMNVGFSNNKIQSSEDVLYQLPLGNYQSCLGVCMGNFSSFGDLDHITNQSISHFWQSTFSWVNYVDAWKLLAKTGTPVSWLFSNPTYIGRII